MFRIDDRTGDVVTTVAVFVASIAVLYLARSAFFILLLSLLFAYLLEPAVRWTQQHSPPGRNNRTSAIALVYLIGVLLLGGLGYTFGPHLVAQIKGLASALPEILQSLSTGSPPSGLMGGHGLSAAQQSWIQDWLANHRDLITQLFARAASSAAYVAESTAWLFAIPILAIFILRDGRPMADAFIAAAASRGNQKPIERILGRVDTMLAKYIRAQLALAGLSFVFYSVSMLVLGFPYAIALGALGGALEFLPAVGWIASAAAILTIGFLTHAHWIWMALLLIVWRVVQDYVNSPRIMGNNLELEPLTVIFALMVGGKVGGIAGLYLSVPVVAVLRIVWRECFCEEDSPAAPADQPIAKLSA
jgi:predicted PurR-regulated permease PerM